MNDQVRDAVVRAQLANAVARRVQIQNVRLISSRLKRIDLEDQQTQEEVRLSFRFKVKHDFSAAAKQIRVGVAFYVSGSPCHEKERSELFSIEASFALDYLLSGEDSASEEQISEFAKLNGIYNAWPYWREYVQSSLSRMGFPSLILPVLTPQAVERMVRESEEVLAKRADTPAPNDTPDVSCGSKG